MSHKDIFIEKAKLIHVDYDFSLVSYTNNKTKVIIIDKKLNTLHLISPSKILRGQKCCIKNAINKNDYFIKKSNEIHNNKYDYSLTNYIKSKEKIKIICNIHGEFYITPSAHLNKQGCAKCGVNKVSLVNTKNTKDFILKSNKIHENFYDYSYVNYKNQYTKVKIKCPKHGIFRIVPKNHVSKKMGCVKCLKEESGKIKYKNFVKKASYLHNNIYSYNGGYLNMTSKIDIRCSIHGIFKQTPHGHLKGHGCPKCNLSKGELKISNILESMGVKFIPQKKFKGCKNKKLLPFDFYLPEKNLCVEYDGEQHFMSKYNWGGEKSLEKQQNNDNIKNIFCSENNINLLRIPYTKYNEIEKIITNIYG